MEDIDRDHAEFWRLGLFYYNPKDPALMVPKRSGLGWTFNFGHWLSFVILVVILAAIAAVVAYT
jgi:uncharacterized membrane protein